jgi:hypothetical protein
MRLFNKEEIMIIKKSDLKYPTDKIVKRYGMYDRYPDAEELLSKIFEGEWSVSSFGDTKIKMLRIDNTKEWISGVSETVGFFEIGHFGRHRCGETFFEALMYLDQALSQDRALGLTDKREWVRKWYNADRKNNLKQNEEILASLDKIY